jgi:hypothetical protein
VLSEFLSRDTNVGVVVFRCAGDVYWSVVVAECA